MFLLVLSFVAGCLTVAAPCVLPLLPVIIGGSLVDPSRQKASPTWVRPTIITASLALSVLAFSLLIKATTLLIGVPPVVWQIIAGGIVIAMGVYYIRPLWWAQLAARSYIHSNKQLTTASTHSGAGGAILTGAALGPVFSSCSPTYALIIATILPATFWLGLLYLIAYVIGMSLTLLLIALLGQTFIVRLRKLSSPSTTIKTIIGVLFILVGLGVVFGLDKQLQTFVLNNGWYDPISNLETTLRR